MNGILLVDKPAGWTSHDVVAKLRGVLGERRMGHSGTLDPMATGLLVVFAGRATRAVSFSENHSKCYEARLRLGLTTDTQDTTGTVLSRCDRRVTRAELEAALPQFRGDILQTPPMYSALKVDGQKLYEIARRGGEVARAGEMGAIPTVMSFDVHPDTLVRGTEVPLINSAHGREELIRRLFGIESVVFIHFDRTVMQMPWQTFIQTLVDEMDAAAFVVGHDFSFGWRGEGTAEKLTAYCAERGLGCDVIPAVMLDGRVVSSTYIRELLENGEVERANAFLGHPHTLSDTVHYGYRLGTKMGTPTINMQFPDGVLVPRHGVYAAKVYLDDGSEHYAVTNVGVRPTVSGGQRVSVESFILDYHGNLYNRQVRLEFYKFLRPERKFDSVDALKARILYDANTTRAYFEAQTQHA